MQCTLLEELPPTAAARLVEAGTSRRFVARSYVFHEGDDPRSVYLIESGILRVDRTLRSGRVVLLTLATPGEVVGELAVIGGTSRSATATAITDSALTVIPARRFEELLVADQDLARVILTRVTRRLQALTDQFVETAAHGASSRVASRIVALMRVAGTGSEAPIELKLPITQEELAQWAGLSREGAVKGLGELREAGVIETGRRVVTILDARALRSAAEHDGG